ncbi:hypothetical protein NL676_037202 [Syzygium grande]|nr:hypothetical protein NL676_037202 [Syzygium grande]
MDEAVVARSWLEIWKFARCGGTAAFSKAKFGGTIWRIELCIGNKLDNSVGSSRALKERVRSGAMAMTR